MNRAGWTIGIFASLLLVLALAATGAAQTQEPGFGGIVGDVDDVEHILASGGPSDLMFRDADDDDRLDNDEPVFLASDSTVSTGDIRIANPRTGDAFSKVTSGASDSGLELTALEGEFRFFDETGSEAFTPGDTLFYDLTRTNDGQASVGDVVLAGEQAGTLVTSSHPNHAYGLFSFDDTPSFMYYDEDDDGTFDTSEAAIIAIREDGYLTVSDVRLGDTDGGPGGSVAELGDADVTYRLSDFDDTWSFQHRDTDGDDTFDRSEPAYLTEGDTVASFAIRLANPTGGHESGTQVIDFDDDWNLQTRSINGEIAYVDDGGSGFTGSDTLYYDADSSGEVERGDIQLTGNDAGTVVGHGHNNIGNDLTSYSGTIRFIDANGDDRYGSGDIVYADTDNDNIVDQNDVQLSVSEDGGDGDPPSISITQPEEGATITQGESLEIEGTATSGDGDLATVTLTVGDEELTVTGLSDWNATWTATEAGEHTLTATVTDENDLTATATQTVTVEEGTNQPPTITITEPDDDQDFGADEPITIAGTATPGDADLASVTVTVGSDTIDVDGLEHWSAEWTPTEPGSYILQATVTDENDETATETLSLSVMATDPPTITIQNPEEGAEVTAGETVTIEGTAEAAEASLSTVTVTVGDDELEVDGLGSWSAAWEATDVEIDEAFTIEATATDEDGLTGSTERTITVRAASDDTPTIPGTAIVAITVSVALALRRGRKR